MEGVACDEPRSGSVLESVACDDLGQGVYFSQGVACDDLGQGVYCRVSLSLGEWINRVQLSLGSGIVLIMLIMQMVAPT